MVCLATNIMKKEKRLPKYMAKVRINFYGDLKQEEPLVVEASCISEAISYVSYQTDIFDYNPKDGRRIIQIAECQKKEDLHRPLEEDIEINIAPMLSGGKNGGFLKIAIAAVLIIVSFVIGGPTAGAFATKLSTAFLSAGIALAIGGVMELIMGQPKLDTNPTGQDPEASRYLGSEGNTVRIGTRIPLLYGHHRAFGHYLSFDVDAIDTSTKVDPPPGKLFEAIQYTTT